MSRRISIPQQNVLDFMEEHNTTVWLMAADKIGGFRRFKWPGGRRVNYRTIEALVAKGELVEVEDDIMGVAEYKIPGSSADRICARCRFWLFTENHFVSGDCVLRHTVHVMNDARHKTHPAFGCIFWKGREKEGIIG